MNKYLVLAVFILSSVSSALFAQEEGYYLLDSYSVNFWEDEDWGRYEDRRFDNVDPPYEGRIHLNEPPGWATFDIVWTARGGYNAIMCAWPYEQFPGYGADWYIEWMMDIDPFSIGQGCSTEFQFLWPDDPDAHPDVQAMSSNWFSVDFSLAHMHKYYSKLDSSLVWLCGSDIPGDKYALYTPGHGWTGVPIIVRLWKNGRTLYFYARKESEAEFTELYSMPCAIGASISIVIWELCCSGEFGATATTGLPWSGKAKYFRIYTNAEKPQYSVNFADSESLDPFIVVPGTESPEKISFTENPGWLRIITEHASDGIETAKNLLVQPFAPNLMGDFTYITQCQLDPDEAGQAIGMKATILGTSGTQEAVCYFGQSSEGLTGYPGGRFFGAGVKGEEVLTDAYGIDRPVYLRIARVGSDVAVGYSLLGSSTGYRRLATLHDMAGGLLNVMVAAGNFGDWGASEATGSIPVDIRAIFVEEETADVEPYFDRDNDFNNGLTPFLIPTGQEDTDHYSLSEHPGWFRLETQYCDGDLNGAVNALVQEFDELVTGGISVETRIALDPVSEGQLFGMQLALTSGGETKNVVLRFGKAGTGITGGGFTDFFEYGFEGSTQFVDASSIGSVLLLRIERYAYKFVFSYSTGTEEDYVKLGQVGGAAGEISSVSLAGGNLLSYGGGLGTPSLAVDIDYFHYGRNLMSDGQCEFSDSFITPPWQLVNVDSTKFSLEERDGWLKVMTSLNADAQGLARKGTNAIRAVFSNPHLGIEGNFDFTCHFEGSFTEPGQLIELLLGPENEDYFIRYGMIGEGATEVSMQAGIDEDIEMIITPNLPSEMLFRIVRNGTSVHFYYSEDNGDQFVEVGNFFAEDYNAPVRYVTVTACNMAIYGATEATASVPVFFDYVRFNRIDDYLSNVEEDSEIPGSFELFQNYPNPFNPETHIRYRLYRPGEVRVSIYNILGQRIRVLADGRQESGKHIILWEGLDDFGRPAASGVYFVYLESDDMHKTRKMILLR